MERFKVFETDRLQLKPTDLDDASFILALVNTPKWLEYIGDRKVYSLKDAENYIKDRIAPQFEKVGFGNYTVIRKSDKIKIGSCGLYDREGLDGIDIGFAFLPDYEKQGYAYESSSRILQAAANDFSLNKISAITAKENKASQKLLEKLGLKFTKYTTLSNDDKELMYFELLLLK